MRVSEKTTENSKRLGWQARPGFEPGTLEPSPLPVLSVITVPLVGMTSEIYSEWLENFDKEIAKQGKHILLSIDNCAAHNTNIQLKQLHYVILHQMPDQKYCLDMDLLKWIKEKYRMKIIQWLLLNLELNQSFNFEVKRRLQIFRRCMALCWAKNNSEFLETCRISHWREKEKWSCSDNWF